MTSDAVCTPPGVGVVDHFVSSADSPGRSFDHWRAPSFASTASLHQIECDPGTFWTDRTRVAFDRMSITTAGIAGMSFLRDPACVRRQDLDGFWIELQVDGAPGFFSSEGRGSAHRPGEILISDFAKPSFKRTELNNYIALHLTRGLVGDLDLTRAHAQRLEPRRQALLRRYMTSLSIKAASIVDVARLERTTLAVLATCVLNDRQMAEVAGAELEGLVLEAVVDFIDGNLHRERLSLTEVVKASGVSRATLYRLLAPHGGLEKLLWRRRLEAAWSVVTDSTDNRTLLQICESLGFAYPSHFSREFKRMFGLSPSKLR